MSIFNPNSPFKMEVLSVLEPAAGIPVLRTLSNYTQHIQNILGLTHYTKLDLSGVLNYWLSNNDIVQHQVPPSWRNLFLIIRLLNLDELAQRMEACLSIGATKEFSPTRSRRKQGEL